MGKNNENGDYMMQGVILERVTQEKDLGVVIDTGGKQAAQCQAATGKARRTGRGGAEGAAAPPSTRKSKWARERDREGGREKSSLFFPWQIL